MIEPSNFAAAAEAEVDEGRLPAAQVAVARQGRLAGAASFGRAVQGGAERPVDGETLFCIYSSTKAVVAAAVLCLIEDGQLSIDERAAEVVPAFAGQDKDAITVEQVMLHVGGFPGAGDAPEATVVENQWSRAGTGLLRGLSRSDHDVVIADNMRLLDRAHQVLEAAVDEGDPSGSRGGWDVGELVIVELGLAGALAGQLGAVRCIEDVEREGARVAHGAARVGIVHEAHEDAPGLDRYRGQRVRGHREAPLPVEGRHDGNPGCEASDCRSVGERVNRARRWLSYLLIVTRGHGQDSHRPAAATQRRASLGRASSAGLART